MREEAIHDPVPLLGVELLGELHRALHVGEQHRHLLALAFERGVRRENLVGEMLRRVGTGVTLRRTRRLSQALAAAVAEFLAHRIRLAAAGARHVTGQARAALATEAGTVGIRVVTARALHRTHHLAAEAPTAGATAGSTPRLPTWASAAGVSPFACGTRAATCTRASDGARVTLAVRGVDLLTDDLPLLPLERRHGDPAPLRSRPDQGGVHELQHRALPERIGDWINQVNAANFAGHSDWRLPSEGGCDSCWSADPTYSCSSCSAHELETILLAPYVCATGPCMNAIFGPTADYYYWSASTIAIAGDPGAWVVSFMPRPGGGVYGSLKAYSLPVRAVR